jgi:hypothetical protein
MLELNYIRDLNLSTSAQIGRPTYLTAASGLVQVGEYLYIVGDDENHLAVFKAHSNEAGTLIRLVEGDLPLDYEERKAAKGDFEVLLVLPSFGSYPYGVLLALGSGSKKTRRRGLLLELNALGEVLGSPTTIDLTELYKYLKKQFSELNIEGAFIQQSTFNLVQRGNKSEDSQNAIIELDLNQVLESLATRQIIPSAAIKHTTSYDIGAIENVPLCFTDAVALPTGDWVFSAAAEATDNAYADGEYLGGALGIVNARGTITHLELIDRQYKVEGISAKLQENRVELLLVTDADNVAIPAKLLSTSLPLLSV